MEDGKKMKSSEEESEEEVTEPEKDEVTDKPNDEVKPEPQQVPKKTQPKQPKTKPNVAKTNPKQISKTKPNVVQNIQKITKHITKNKPNVAQPEESEMNSQLSPTPPNGEVSFEDRVKAIIKDKFDKATAGKKRDACKIKYFYYFKLLLKELGN